MKKTNSHIPKELYRKLIDDLYDGVYFVNCDRKIIFWNSGATQMTGYRKKEVIGKFCYEDLLQHVDKNGRRLCSTKTCPLINTIKSGKALSFRAYCRKKDGLRFPVDIYTKPLKYKNETIGAFEVFRDASAQERVEKQIERAQHLSLIDDLTQLPNRRYIKKMLKFELDKFKWHKEDIHIAIVDIDHFKRVNDKHGHKEGDLLLKRTSQILDHMLRTTDFIGRYGGDEFFIILPHTSRRHCSGSLERMRKTIARSKICKEKITVSMGIAKILKGEKTNKIFERADCALYKAKKGGRNRIKFL